ncbi:universal stress protein [Aliagarivorans taiwanensis]|uniref:universal stress protein n=1 Tax=Aliagarivorans taiwanensis TaxID=561966 RepID=UPI00040A7C71|nr:universal stress protein [Aliagarivorans taiwanensis]
MYRTILVPVDLSEDGFSDKVIKQAAQLLDNDGQLWLLNVVPGYQMPMVGSFFPKGSFEHFGKVAKQQLKEFADKHLGDSGLNYSLLVKEGKPADVILKYAAKHKVELIALASHKHSRVSEGMLGSVANKVVSRAPIPVLVVK